MKYKYPRTFHLPWSEGKSADDIRVESVDHFAEERVVVTEKLDGENTTIYHEGTTHARSVNGSRHESRSWVSALAAALVGRLPEGWRICGENMYAKHSLEYDKLPSYFLVFSIWTEMNECLSWSDTVAWCKKLGLEHVPVLYEGTWDVNAIRALGTGESAFGPEREGYVVRASRGFCMFEFPGCVAKSVRKNHVQTDEHWLNSALVKNKLKGA